MKSIVTDIKILEELELVDMKRKQDGRKETTPTVDYDKIDLEIVIMDDIREVSNMDDTREVIDLFFNELVNQKHELDEFLELYYYSEKRIDLLNNVAKYFFGELFYIYVDRIILNMSKITDPGEMKNKKVNLSLDTIHERLESCDSYPLNEAEKCIGEMKKITKGVRNLRNKIIAHNDLVVIKDLTKMKDLFIPEKANEFYEHAQKYITIVYEGLSQEPRELETNSSLGVRDLIKSLKRSFIAEDILEKDPSLFHKLYTKTKFCSVNEDGTER